MHKGILTNIDLLGLGANTSTKNPQHLLKFWGFIFIFNMKVISYFAKKIKFLLLKELGKFLPSIYFY